MKNAVILHGLPSEKEYQDLEKPSPSNAHWLPWLQKQLLVHNILAQTPEMPAPYHPEYEKWRKEFEYQPIDESTMLIGHSLGGGFLLRWLSENKTKVGIVALAAPWLDPDGRLDTGFFDFTLDPHLADHCEKVVILYSTNDMERILESVKRCKAELHGIEYKEFQDKGHFLAKHMGGSEFPGLLNVLVNA